MPGVFISYRRSDTAPLAARLKKQLDSAFGDAYVFMDVDSLRPGEPFKQVIESTIESIEVVLALIGHDWATVTDAAGARRLENPGDFVRLELATGFQFERVVIPVLLENASMPRAMELPEPIALLAQRHAIEVRDASWDTDVERLVRRLEEVVDTIPPCPYPGMVAFARTDAARFFGRTKEIAEIKDRLASEALLCLVGPSGCGKSSLIEAGVVADLESTQPTRWIVRTLRPGRAPMAALGEALGADLDATTPPEQIVASVRQAMATERDAVARLLLVVDQLEELFAQANADEQEQFIAAVGAIHDLDDASIVLAIRADFYGELMESTLWPLVQGGKVDVPPLAGDALAEAIAEPAKSCHVALDADLLERLVTDAGSEPGALPLLQEALVRLWATMHLHRISLAAYESIGGDGRGGLSAAVAETADAALASLSPEQASIAKRVLLRLVQFGEGRPDTRRQLRFEDLRSEGDDERLLEDVLDILAGSRLVTLTGAPTPSPTGDAQAEERVDLAHEALIAGWPTMRTWLAERRDAELGRRRLEGLVTTWEQHDRTAGFLDDVQLREAQRWLAGPDADELGVPSGLSELVAASASKLRRRRRLRIGAIAGLVGLLIAAIVLAGVFLRARNDANHRANVALSRERAASALAAISQDPQSSLSLALDAVDTLADDDAATSADRREAVAALRDAVRASRVRAVLRGHKAEVVSAHFDPTGRRVVTAGWDGTARVWDADSGKSRAVLDAAGKSRAVGHTGSAHLETADFSPDGTRVVTAGPDGIGRIWNAATGALLISLPHKPKSKVLDAEFAPDGRLVVTAGDDGTARIWEADTGTRVALLGKVGGAAIRYADFSRDGAMVATGDDGGLAVVWNASTGNPLESRHHGDAVTSVRFGRNGTIVTASADGTARVWDPLARGSKSVVLRGHKREVTDAELSPDGTRVVTASFDGTARLWSARTGKELTVPLVHGDAVTTAAFSPDGSRVVTASADQTARIWEAATGKELAELRGHDSYVGSAEFSRDGKRVVTSSFDQTSRIWDAAAGEPLFASGSERFPIARATLSPDGRLLLATPPTGDPRVLDAETGARLATLPVHDARVVSALFDAGGRHIVTADEDAGLRVWEAATGKPTSSRPLQGKPVIAVPSPDDAHIVSLSINRTTGQPMTTVALWDRTSPQPLTAWQIAGRGQEASFDAAGRRMLVWTFEGDVSVWDIASRRRLAAFSDPELRSASLTPDGARVVTAGTDRIARIRDLAGGQEMQDPPRHALAIVAASFSEDGRRLLTASRDKTARLWDAQTGDRLVSFRGHETELSSAAFDPTDRWVVTASLDGTARVWDAQTGQELALFRHPAEVLGATLDRNGRHVLTLDSIGRVRVFRCETCLPLDELVHLARARALADPE